MGRSRSVARSRGDFNLGGEQAEADPLLQDAFYESTHYSTLSDRNDSRCFIVGRTGSGKSAILNRIEKEDPEHVIRINPEDLSLPYIADLQAVTYLASLDVHLDPFFIALWKHVLLIEIIRDRYKVNSPQAKQNFLLQLKERLVRDKSKSIALEYLDEFEGKFWCETDERVRDITRKFEEQIKSEASGALTPGMPVSLRGSSATGSLYSEETKAEQAERFQRIVNETQLPRLNKMFGVLDEDILDSPQYYRYVVIDDLDRDWVDKRILNDLIRCLFRAVIDLKRVRNLKVLVALRTNIFEHLDFGSTGGQEEKFRSLTYQVRWSKLDLEDLIGIRAQEAAAQRGIVDVSTAKDILPATNATRGNAFDYILDRTLMRPRDALAFFNEAFTHSSGRHKLTWEMIHTAERAYSHKRLLALRDEWKPSYPGIDSLFNLFASSSAVITRVELGKIFDDAALLLVDGRFEGVRWMTEIAQPIWDYYGDEEWGKLYLPLAKLLYKIGFLGCMITRSKSPIFVYNEPGFADQPNLLRDAIGFAVHSAFKSSLDIVENSGKGRRR
jgi:hypothetical protein